MRHFPHQSRNVPPFTIFSMVLLLSACTPITRAQSLVSSWGSNQFGQLGASLKDVISVSGGQNHTLALRADGTAFMWGVTDSFTAVPVPVLTGVVGIAGGGSHSAALKADGSVWTWGTSIVGSNPYGQLGSGTTTARTTPQPVVGPGEIGLFTGCTSIASGRDHCIALKSNGSVWAWGRNDWGQIGDSTTTNRLAPSQVVGPGGEGVMTDVVAVAGGYYHTLGLRACLKSRGDRPRVG
jgi:alpha-tubulin suppressor-like RCC1 family protein